MHSQVDTLLLEANERLQSHLSERMSALQQKRELVSEVEQLRAMLDEAVGDHNRLLKEANHLRKNLDELRNEAADGLRSHQYMQMSNAQCFGEPLNSMDALLAVDPSGSE